jgi:hypothetical protein
VPGSDVDRAKRYHEAIGFRCGLPGGAVDASRLGLLDHHRQRDHVGRAGLRSGSLQLVLADVEAARAELVDRGVDVGEAFHDVSGVFHQAGTAGRVGNRPGSGTQRLRLVRLVQRSGRQRLAAARGEAAGSRPVTGRRRSWSASDPVRVTSSGSTTAPEVRAGERPVAQVIVSAPCPRWQVEREEGPCERPSIP